MVGLPRSPALLGALLVLLTAPCVVTTESEVLPSPAFPVDLDSVQVQPLSMELQELDADTTAVADDSSQVAARFVEKSDLGDASTDAANPVAANPAPRDYYLLPNTRQAGAMLSCNGRFDVDVPGGNLKLCANICHKCALCKGFVHDDGGDSVPRVPKCVFKNRIPSEECKPPECKKDSYARCPPGMWSDGISVNATCFQAPRGFSKINGEATEKSGGVDMTCNHVENSNQLAVKPSRNLQPCADMCDKCVDGKLKCAGFVRTRSGTGTGDVCRFKSILLPTDPVNKHDDAFLRCPSGKWSDGTFETCKPAPKNYIATYNKEGGNDISCEGAATMEYGQEGDLDKCAKVCSNCKFGTKECTGFIRGGNNKCTFKTTTAPIEAGQKNVKFASSYSKDSDAYTKCPHFKYSDGTMKECEYPDDWKVTVKTGTDDDCRCGGKGVGDKRFSSATWTFDVFSDRIPMFISSKPQVVAPCANATSDGCNGKSDITGRTSGAGQLPTKVRITAGSNDAWCMKSFCISSAKAGSKRWVVNTAEWLNPGEPDDGKCLPPTVKHPKNNWGWCKYVAPGVQSNLTSCNDVNDFKTAFFEFPLVQQAGDCSTMGKQ